MSCTKFHLDISAKSQKAKNVELKELQISADKTETTYN